MSVCTSVSVDVTNLLLSIISFSVIIDRLRLLPVLKMKKHPHNNNDTTVLITTPTINPTIQGIAEFNIEELSAILLLPVCMYVLLILISNCYKYYQLGKPGQSY